jgi:activator-of-BECN1-regulated-autophagy protein 1
MSLAQVAGRAAQLDSTTGNVEAPQIQPPADQDPCVVKLKLWEYEAYADENGDMNIKPLTELRLVLPHTVLCSEMGAHFSPCGRFIATTQACKPPLRLSLSLMADSARPYICELRVYSIDGGNFGEVLCARAVKAAHCLTSIQFSPSSAHVLLAYGRRHQSLSLLMADGDTFTQVNTVIEVYDAKSMHLLRIIPSAEDEVNVACFHPRPGGGAAYGTKEGKLRLLVHADAQRSDTRIASNADFTSMHQS